MCSAILGVRVGSDHGTLVVVRTEVQNGARAVGQERDQDHTIRHGLEGRGHEFDHDAVVQDDGMFHAAVGCDIAVQSVMVVLCHDGVAEDRVAGDGAEDDFRVVSQLLGEEGVREDAGSDLRQLGFHELLDIAGGVAGTDGHDLTEIDGVDVGVGVHDIASRILRAEDVASELTTAEHLEFVVDGVHHASDDVQVLGVTADVLELSQTCGRIDHAFLTDGVVHDEVTAARQLVAHRTALQIAADVGLALVVLVVTSIEGEANHLDGQRFGESLLIVGGSGQFVVGRDGGEALGVEDGVLTIHVGADVEVDQDALVDGETSQNFGRIGGVGGSRNDGAVFGQDDGEAVDVDVTIGRLLGVRHLSQTALALRNLDEELLGHCFGSRDVAIFAFGALCGRAGLGQVDIQTVDEDVVFNEVRVVVLLIAGLAGIQSEIEHVDDFLELVDAVGDEFRILSVVIRHERDDAFQNGADGGRVFVQVDHADRFGFGLGQIVDREILTNDRHIALADGLHGDDAGSQGGVELQQSDSQDDLQVGLHAVHLDAERFHTDIIDGRHEGGGIQGLEGDGAVDLILAFAVGGENGGIVLAKSSIQKLSDFLGGHAEIGAGDMAVLHQIDDCVRTESVFDGVSLI